ncbi:MAG: SRPBCC family protein [Sinobacterium sp.]|nr:SRPBCC family protein [Sinobacterium sp.]
MAREIFYKVAIDIPRDKAWDIMQDITAPHLYVPGLLKTEMHTEQTTGVGASRRVFKKMMALDETVTEWNEGYGFRIRLHDGPKSKPLPKSFFIYSIADGENNTTMFTATMGYSFPLGFIGKIIDSLFVAPIVQMEIRNVALAVKHYYENGTTPTPADLKALRQKF